MSGKDWDEWYSQDGVFENKESPTVQEISSIIEEPSKELKLNSILTSNVLPASTVL
jgi:hypothetical protein